MLPERAKSGKMLNDTALKSCTITAERRATAVLIAQAVSKRLRHGGEEGLPQHGLGNVLLVDLLLSDCYVTPELAAQLVDIDQAFPAPGGYDRLAEWAWALDDETATRLALMLLVLQDAGPSQVISRFPSAVGAALGVDTAALVMQAESMVRERLRLELVKRGSVAAVNEAKGNDDGLQSKAFVRATNGPGG